MQRRSIRGIDTPVSTLALGGWLTIGDAVDDDEALRILHTAASAGINLLDLADVYADGGAERVVGRFLQQTDRQQLVLASKVFWPTSEDPADRGLSRRHIHASIDRTLARLGVEHLDLYYCHREDPSVPLAETVAAMDELVRAGKIRAWGTSCWRPTTLREAHRLAQELGAVAPAVEQSPYNLLERWIETELVPCCQQLDMALVTFSPLAQGMLTGKYLEGVPAGSRAATTTWLEPQMQPDVLAKVRQFVALCEQRAMDPTNTAIAWITQRPGITSAILGVRSCEQLERNLAASQITIDAELAEAIDGIFPPPRRRWWKSWLKRLLRK